MAIPRTVVVSCGASHVSSGIFTIAEGQVRCESITYRELDYDFSQEDRWLDAVLRTLREMVGTEGIKGRARVIMPGFLLLTKTFKIAHVEASRQAQAIAYEAQQNIPYPLSEVNWDYQILADDGVECEVLFIAVKSEIARRFCTEVSRIGLEPVCINASTILDCMALRQTEGEVEDDVLIANIGARATNLTFVHKDGFLVRNIQLGGNSLTQALADSMGKGFEEAEQFKSLTLNGAEDLSESEPLKIAAGTFMRRLNQELTRSIVNFRQQRKGAAPKKLFLTGRGALLPGLAEYLAEHQRMEVGFFDPSSNLVLGPGVNAETDSLALYLATELVGDVAGAIDPEAVGINLLPRDIQGDLDFRRRSPLLAVAALCAAIAPWPFAVLHQERANNLEQQREAVVREVNYHRSLAADIESTLASIHGARDEIAGLSGLMDSRYNWIQFFADLQDSLYQVGDVWLDNLSIQREGRGVEGPTDNGQPEMELRGRLLLREGDSDIAAEYTEIDAAFEAILTERIRALSEGFSQSEFVDPTRTPRVRFDFQQIRDGSPLLPFTLNLFLSEERPL